MIDNESQKYSGKESEQKHKQLLADLYASGNPHDDTYIIIACGKEQEQGILPVQLGVNGNIKHVLQLMSAGVMAMSELAADELLRSTIFNEEEDIDLSDIPELHKNMVYVMCIIRDMLSKNGIDDNTCHMFSNLIFDSYLNVIDKYAVKQKSNNQIDINNIDTN